MNVSGAWRAALFAGLRAARQNLFAGVLVWIVAAVVVYSYYSWPRAHQAWERLAAFRASSGLVYPVISTGLFGGVLPLMFQTLTAGSALPRPPARAWIFASVFWGYKGIETALFYDVQNWLFGPGTNFLTVAAKVCVDMFIWCPVWAVPCTAVAYVWKDAGFSRERFWDLWGPHGFHTYVLPTLVSNWLIWGPSVCFLYLLPLPLQVPLFNLVLFLFVLILTVVTRKTRAVTSLGP